MKNSILRFIIGVVLLLFMLLPYIIVRFDQGEAIYELIRTQESPDKQYTAYAYLVNSGALDAYSLEVYVEFPNGEKKCVYNQYKEYDVEMCWDGPDVLIVNKERIHIDKYLK